MDYDRTTQAAEREAAGWARRLAGLAAAAKAARNGAIDPEGSSVHQVHVERHSGRRTTIWKPDVETTHRFAGPAEVDALARSMVRGMHVRRLGWTRPESDGRIECDTAALLLSIESTTIQVEASVGVDGTLYDAGITYTDSAERTRLLDAEAHRAGAAGAAYLAALFRVPMGEYGTPYRETGTDEPRGQPAAANAQTNDHADANA